MTQMAEQSPGPPADSIVPLADGQRRAISALLLRIAETVQRAETALGEPVDEQTQYIRTAYDIPPEIHPQIRAALASLVNEADRIARLCSMPEEVRSARARLQADFSLLWSDVEDTMPDRLRGYGPVAPVTASKLEPHLRALARLSLLIARLA